MTFVGFFPDLFVSVHLRHAILAEVANGRLPAGLLTMTMFSARTNAFVHSKIVHVWALSTERALTTCLKCALIGSGRNSRRMNALIAAR